MGFNLGGFTNGAMQGVNFMQGVLSNAQQYGDRQAQIQAADAVKSAMTQQNTADTSAGAGYVPLDTTVPASSDTSTPTSSVTPVQSAPLADPSKTPAPDSEGDGSADTSGLFDKDGKVAKGALDAKPAKDSTSKDAAGALSAGLSKAAAGITPTAVNAPIADTMTGMGGYQDASIQDPGAPTGAATIQPPMAQAALASRGMTYQPQSQTPASPGQTAPAPGPTATATAAGVPGMAGTPSGPAIGGPPRMPGMPAPTMAGAGAPAAPVASPGAPGSQAQGQASGNPALASAPGVPGQQGSPSGDPAGPATQAAAGPNPAGAIPGVGSGAPTPPGTDAGNATPSLGSRIMSAINPISSASAAEAPPGQGTTVGQGGQAQGGQAQGRLPPAQTDDPQHPVPLPGAAAPAVAVAAPAAKVAPDQQGPTDQSEATPQYSTPPLSARPWMALMHQAPDTAKLVAQVADQTGVTPERLALHWNLESSLRPSAPTSSTGAIGPLQIEPATWDSVDPHHQYDITKPPGALMVAGLVCKKLDDQFGQNSVASFASYEGGSGAGESLQAGKTTGPANQAYIAKGFPGQKLGPQNILPSVTIDPQAAGQAVQGGPDTFIHYLASVTPPGMPMGAAWKAAETQGVYAMLRTGNTQGANEVQEMIQQMSRQGANNALMDADKAMAAGDGVGAAQMLAKAHAFFPDGTMGRFGVDKSGQVWATRVSESDPSVQIGKPMLINRASVQAQLVTTQDPNRYIAQVKQQQMQAAQIAMEQAHGKYYSDLINTKNAGIEAQLQARELAVAGRENIANQNNATHLQTTYMNDTSRPPRGALTGNPAQASAIDKETSAAFGAGNTNLPNGGTPQQNSDGSLIYAALRHTSGALGSMPPPRATDIASGVVTGRYHPIPQKDGTVAVVDPARGNRTLAYLPQDTAEQVFGAPQPAKPAGPGPAIGSAAPFNPAMSSAVPPTMH